MYVSLIVNGMLMAFDSSRLKYIHIDNDNYRNMNRFVEFNPFQNSIRSECLQMKLFFFSHFFFS